MKRATYSWWLDARPGDTFEAAHALTPSMTLKDILERQRSSLHSVVDIIDLTYTMSSSKEPTALVKVEGTRGGAATPAIEGGHESKVGEAVVAKSSAGATPAAAAEAPAIAPVLHWIIDNRMEDIVGVLEANLRYLCGSSYGIVEGHMLSDLQNKWEELQEIKKALDKPPQEATTPAKEEKEAGAGAGAGAGAVTGVSNVEEGKSGLPPLPLHVTPPKKGLKKQPAVNPGKKPRPDTYLGKYYLEHPPEKRNEAKKEEEAAAKDRTTGQQWWRFVRDLKSAVKVPGFAAQLLKYDGCRGLLVHALLGGMDLGSNVTLPEVSETDKKNPSLPLNEPILDAVRAAVDTSLVQSLPARKQALKDDVVTLLLLKIGEVSRFHPVAVLNHSLHSAFPSPPTHPSLT